ncbi:MAG: FAD-dependent monooxygenase [Hyphomicrobiales bacterium]
MESFPETFDTLIVGAGPIGLIAANAFSRAGYSVALVAPPSRPDNLRRTVALMKSSVDFLVELDLWDAVKPHATPLARMVLIDDTGSLFRPPAATFDSAELGLPAFGYTIDVAHLVEILDSSATASGGIVRFSSAVDTIACDTGRATVTLSAGRTVSASLVIGADGRKSVVRKGAGIAAREWTYNQSALTVLLEHERDHDNTSTEFHTREGPFTLVPLPGRHSSLVWLASPGRAQSLHALDDASLSRLIEAQSRSLLGKMRVSGPRALVQMAGLSVAMIARDRLALVGEAAHAFPPIGAQGLNLGIRDVRDLVRSASNAGDPGSTGVIVAYQRKRRRDIFIRTSAVETLNRSLLSPLLPVDFARGFGLLAVSVVKPLRYAVMKHGLG